MKLFILSVLLLIISLVIAMGDAHLLRAYASVYQTLQECQYSEKLK